MGSLKLLKSLLIFITGVLLLFLAANANAITWHTANQATIQWVAVTKMENGNPIPTDSTVEYAVYLVNAITDPNKTNPSEVWRGSATTCLITLNTEGQYIVGVQSFQKLTDGSLVSDSKISWSDDPLAVGSNGIFGIRYFLPLAAPTGLSSGE